MVLKLKKIKEFGLLPLAAVFAFAAALLVFTKAAVEGAGRGLRLAAGTLVPSLFPFLVLGSFAALSPSCSSALRIFSPIMRYVFRLPAAAASAVLFGLLGGYPLGCSSAAELLKKGDITEEQAQRLCCFCVNPGPAFVITAVGSVMLSSVKAGVIIFASLLISSVAIGIFLGATAKIPPKSVPVQNFGSEMQAFVSATEKAAFSVIKICAWTVLFSCFGQIIESAGIRRELLTAIKCVFEVTGGCAEAAGQGNICILAAALGFGGVCVGCQVMADVRKTNMPTAVFFAFRAVNAALAAIICAGLLKLFPIEQSAFANVASVTARQVSYSVPASAALICLCSVFVIDLDRSKKMC